tara:strand:+ start:10523 stop:11083 length:561 start_codon:yes stop_codon:yes gene_type:complete
MEYCVKLSDAIKYKTEEEALSGVIKSLDHRYGHITSILKFDWPVAERMLVAVINYLTLNILVDGKPLALSIIKSALDEYAAVVFHNNKDGNKYSDDHRIFVFEMRLIEALYKYNEVTVKAKSGKCWKIGDSYSLKRLIEVEKISDLTVVKDKCGSDHSKFNITQIIRNARYSKSLMPPKDLVKDHA